MFFPRIETPNLKTGKSYSGNWPYPTKRILNQLTVEPGGGGELGLSELALSESALLELALSELAISEFALSKFAP